MMILLLAAFAATFAGAVLGLLVAFVRSLARRPAWLRWRTVLAIHGGLLAVHLFVTVPCALALVGTRLVGTRGDESAYAGPRLGPDGAWLLQTRESLADDVKCAFASVDSQVLREAAARAVALTARDGVPLRAFLVAPTGAPATPPRFTAILLHGLYRGALELETPGSMLRELGGEVLLLEARNHGGSGKARATFGRDERLDVLAAADFLRARHAEQGGRAPPLLLFAVSLGTAAATLAAPEIDGLAGLVLDAPMDTLRATAARLLASSGSRTRSGPSFPQPFRSLLLFAAEHVGGLDLDAVQPIAALRRLPPSLPVLLIGAGRDQRMPPACVEACFAALPQAPADKTLWIVPDADHGHVWLADPAGYRAHLAALVDRIAARP